MSDGYVPRAGTTAHKIIEFLKKQPAGASFTGPEFEAKLKVKHASQQLRKALEADIVVAEKRGNAFAYSLPAPPQPTDGKLTIGSWSDGDVIVQGGTPNEDGSVTYTRDQVLQLIRFVTAPHVGMPVHSELAPVATPLLTASSQE
jgi:hypothetical protein